MASLAYLSNIRVMGQQFSQSVEAIKYIIEEAKGKTNQSLRLVCKKCSNFMLKMELNTRTSSCYEEEKEIVGACALKGANIFLNIVESTLQEFDRKRLILHCVDLVRMIVVCNTIDVQANTIGAVIQTLCEIEEKTTEDLWMETVKIHLWTARRVLEDAIFRIERLENQSKMRVIISVIADGLTNLQTDANSLNYTMIKIGEDIVPVTPPTIGAINTIYTRATKELEAIRSNLFSLGPSLIDQRNAFVAWVEKEILTLTYLAPHPVPSPKAGVFYTFLY
jgi:hypothetical protein